MINEICSNCRRANSSLCHKCKDGCLFVLNDNRKFYFINDGNNSPEGPVEAFLLAYRSVGPNSYVWTKGMKDWDIAGNVVFSKVPKINYEYCPVCDNEMEFDYGYSVYDATTYRCKQCGFCFSYGGTVLLSDNKLDQNKNIQESACLSVGMELFNAGWHYKIMGVEEIGSSFILYSAKRYRKSIYKSPVDTFENVMLLECFISAKDSRGNDGKQRIRSRHIVDGVIEQEFYDRVSRITSASMKQILRLYESRMDNDFFEANSTKYLVIHENSNLEDCPMICPKCNRRNAENVKVCFYCGAAMKRFREPAPPMYGPPFVTDSHAVAYGPPLDIDMQATVYGPQEYSGSSRNRHRPVVYGPPPVFIGRGCGLAVLFVLLIALLSVLLFIALS